MVRTKETADDGRFEFQIFLIMIKPQVIYMKKERSYRNNRRREQYNVHADEINMK